MKKKIIEYAFDDKKILNKEITKDLASELIEQFM